METLKRDLARSATLALIFVGAMLAPIWVTGLASQTQLDDRLPAETAADTFAGETTAVPTTEEQADQQDARAQAVLHPADGALDYASDPAAGAPEFFPRPPGEWQGMLVDMNMQALCSDTSPCGLGQVCTNGLCSACTSDMQCMVGEMCVLDHCIPQENASCVSSSQCGDDELCVLSGYSTDLRGTSGTRSYCLADTGGTLAETLDDPDYDKSGLPEEPPEAVFEEFADEQTRALAGGRIVRPESVLDQLEVKTLSTADLPDRIED